jgi:hypothetical protein
MNVSAKHKTHIPWRRVLTTGLVLAVLGYSYSRPTLERWFNISLPAISNQDRAAEANRPSAGSSQSQFDPYQASLPQSSASKAGSQESSAPSRTAAGGTFQLREVGRDRYETPAGLLYTMGPRGEHRIEHVMRHAKDQPNRPTHSVFLADDQDSVLKLIDEAYGLAKSKSPRSQYESSKGNDKYDVDMKRKVGFDGGKKGQRNNYRSLNKVRMILDGNRVITAFPVR